MTRRIYQVAGLVALAITFGCAGANVRTYSKPITGQRQYGKVKKVAVLPFDSVAEGAQAPKLTNDMFLQSLLSLRTFESVEEPRYVAELMKKLKLRNTEGLDREIVRKMGEEVKAEALILGNVLLFGQQKDSEIVEYSHQVDVLDVESGDILWSGQTYAASSTTLGEVLGVNKGPSPNDVAGSAVRGLVARLDQDFRQGREGEVVRMLEAEKAQKLSEEAAPAPEGAPAAAPAGPAAAPAAPKEEEGEEILLQVKPK